jgi:hypothetical protein
VTGTVWPGVDERLREHADRLTSFGRALERGEVAARARPPAKVGPATPRVRPAR